MIRYSMGLFLLVSLQQVKAQSKMLVRPDSIKIITQSMVIRNTTRNIKGYLLNTGDGITGFSQTGKAIQFSVGTQGSPVAGDTAYSHPALMKKSIKVWRSGLLQKKDPQRGVNIDSIAGKIIFYPALTQAEKIYIEALDKMAITL
ncbi:hypothetical protein [Chitinophaga sp. HK235]|uniref:hypothetical protein n=1 Tax=Chitinophaga sp. HK235 TaxID=2952571 RepID=UPI001BA72C2A|nr:hypothetical protein [Chitinophaga sp. HK235]